MVNKRMGLGVSRIAWLLAPVAAVGLALAFATRAWGTPPIEGPSVAFGGSNGAGGASLNFVTIAAGDLDNDGWMDLVTGSSSGTNEVRVWENEGTPFSGTWSSGNGNAVGDITGAQVNSVALGDLDHDGDLDLVSGDNNNEIYIWANDGTPFSGTWSVNYDIGDGVNDIFGVATADLDGDGNLDIVSVSVITTGYELIAWENPYTAADPNPFDQAWTAHNVADTVSLYTVALADLNRDGRVDIIAGNQSNQVRIWSNDGSWSFTSQATLAADGDVGALAVVDFSRDGYLDIASGGPVESGGTYEVILWENDGDAPFDWSFTEHDIANTADDVRGLAAADFNNDGYPDFAAVTNTGEDNEVIAWENDADTTFDWSFAQVDVGAETQHVRAVAAADFDNDGDADLATGRNSGTGYEVAVWENILTHRNAPFGGNGHGVGAQDTVLAVDLGDLDGDGDLDAIAAGYSGQINAEQNDGTPFSGTWGGGNVGVIPATDTVLAAALGDLDGDGDLDITTGGWFSTMGGVGLWQNDGTPFDGPWTSNGAGTGSAKVYDVALGDLDNDGDLDIVSVGELDWYNGKVIAWENDRTPWSGEWLPHSVLTNTNLVSGVALGDLDGDGDLDIAAGCMCTVSCYDVFVLQNDGTPFDDVWTRNAVTYGVNDIPAVALNDLDGDGDLDIAAEGRYQESDDEVFAWQNDGTPFSDFWTQIGIGDTSGGYDVAAGDLDNDGDLDIVSASTGPQGQQIAAWFNDGLPFDGGWTQSIVGSNSSVYAVRLGDLDGDGDLDALSGSWSDAAYEVMAWKNVGGSAGLFVSDTWVSGYIANGAEDDVLKVVFTHNGVSGDESLELNRFNLTLARSDCSTALTTAEANAFIDNLRVRLDDGDGVFSDTADALVADVADLSLTNGVQAVTFADGDSRVWVTATATISRTYWVSVRATADSSSRQPNNFCMIFDPDADALVEAKSPDFSVSIQDTDPTATGDVPTVVRLSSLRAAGRGAALPLVALLVLAGAAVGSLQYRRRSR
jgi:hypothetical protein